MTRFLIEKDGVYYLTTGKLLTYDRGRAGNDQQKKNDVDRVAAEFERICNLPHTWHKAVEISDAAFLAVNTGQSG
ncbi:MAG TPA: hypothetical protein VE989_00265 [Sphingomicrobium sp.]|jgi:hypothetical protein|nr:hypothetical protein [Sphingomicrobium sp.]